MKLEDFSFRNRKQEKFCLVNNVKRYKNSNYALISFSTPNCLGQILISIFYIHFVLLQSTFHPANKTASIHTLSLYQTPCINARCNPTISTDATPILSTPISITTPRSLNTRYSTAQTRCPRRIITTDRTLVCLASLSRVRWNRGEVKHGANRDEGGKVIRWREALVRTWRTKRTRV